jgi:hypothetical protein
MAIEYDYRKLKVAEIPRGPAPEVQPGERRCAFCGARLNRYNKDKVCSPCRRRNMPKVGKALSGGQANKEFDTK